MTTNNQAALQAAATVFEGSKAYVRPETVTGMAWQFKLWLDRKDTEDEAKREAAEEVSHHISCSSRIRVAWFACDCTPVKYEGLKTTSLEAAAEELGVDLEALRREEAAKPSLCQTEQCQLPNGHAGVHLDQRGNIPAPKPGPRHQSHPHVFGSAWCRDNCPPGWK